MNDGKVSKFHKLHKEELLKGDLGNYQWIETEDGSYTLRSDYFDENFHSTSGAYAETVHNFIQGCEVVQICSEHSNVYILEVGLGLGIGPIATLESVKNIHNLDKSKKLIFYSLELDSFLVESFLQKQSASNFSETRISDFLIYEAELAPGFHFKCLCGDARKTIKYLQDQSVQFHAIFQDAFSPKKNPTLWTQEWFEDLLKLAIKNKTILSTYSASIRVRKGLYKAGWKVENRIGFGRKRSSTRAIAQNWDEYKNQEEVLKKILKEQEALTRTKQPPYLDAEL